MGRFKILSRRPRSSSASPSVEVTEDEKKKEEKKKEEKTNEEKKREDEEIVSRGETTEDPWKLVDYPISMSDSDSGDIEDVFVEIPYITLTRHQPEERVVNTMPLEHTRYSIQTTRINVERDEGREEGWGATFVENISRIGTSTVRSLLISDMVDDGIMENAGIKCGDVIININGEDISRWSFNEMLEELHLLHFASLTLITYRHQQTKYLLFLDLSPGDITYIWALNNLVSLHVCGTRLKNGIVDLRGVSCKGVLQELAVTKSELDTIHGIKGLEQFSNLRRLNLSHNRLYNLDEEVMLKLVSLEELRLGNNNLEKFPLVITEMVHLRDVSLVYNLISTIPEQILRMQSLENLHLDNNYLTELPEFVIQQLPSLRSLTFSNNHLSWDQDYVRECFHLALIDFSGNGVRTKKGLDSFGPLVGRNTLRRKGQRGLLKEPSLLKMALARST